MSTNRAVSLSAGLIACISLLLISRSNADEEAKPDLSLVEAADLAWKSTKAEFAAGQRDVEELYQWSRRLMDAELAAGETGARKDHLSRMRDLYHQMDARYNAGAELGSERRVAATKYYLLEAELILQNNF